jgi:Tol biopolymer transport system component
MTAPSLSRDGAYAAYTLDAARDSITGSEDSYLWIQPTRTQEAPFKLPSAVEGDFMARFSPSSNAIAFLSSRDGRAQIYVASSVRDSARRISSARAAVQKYVWSTDGRYIAYTSTDTTRPTSHYTNSDVIQADFYVRNQLWIVDAQTGNTARVTSGEYDVREVAFSPDGKELAAIVAPTGNSFDDIRQKLVVIDRSTGRIVRTLDDVIRGVTRVLRWSPDGRWITYLQDSPTRRSFWLAVAPAAGGAIVSVLKDFPGTVMQVEWMGVLSRAAR